MLDIPSLVDDIMRMKCLAAVMQEPDGKSVTISAVSTLTKRNVVLKGVSKDKSNEEVLQEIYKKLNS
jgi:hypothetical protein|nr:MAG TPA: hypothetical protein [Caudoviricetes sp.]